MKSWVVGVALLLWLAVLRRRRDDALTTNEGGNVMRKRLLGVLAVLSFAVTTLLARGGEACIPVKRRKV